MTAINVQLLLTGNELMSGDVIDSNSALIGYQLAEIGITIRKKVTLADNLSILTDEINTLSQSCDVLIINGGLGPTSDDLTAQALANACHKPLTQHPLAYQHLVNWCQKKQVPLSKENLKQALLPQGCGIIANKTGSAVGFLMTFNQCDIYCTPGVPSELANMLRDEILPKFKQDYAQSHYTIVKRMLVFGIGESTLQQLIDQQIPQWPADISLGFRANAPYVEVKLTATAANNEQVLRQYYQQVKALLGDHLLHDIVNKPIPMAEHVVTLLKEKNLTITAAESCTGGLIASLLTQISGASQAFEAGFVTYSNNMKSKLLNVKPATLKQHGAVSQEVVEEMAFGALKASGANYAIAVSGVAGPTGGTPDKPVGSVWIAWGSITKMQSRYFCIKGNRDYFQLHVAHRALDLIRRQLINCQEQPQYFDQAQLFSNKIKL